MPIVVDGSFITNKFKPLSALVTRETTFKVVVNAILPSLVT